MSASSPGTGNLDLEKRVGELEERLKNYTKYDFSNTMDVELPYTIPQDGALSIIISTTDAKYSGAEVTIDGKKVFALGALEANCPISQEHLAHVSKGNVINKTINSAGGNVIVKYLYD